MAEELGRIIISVIFLTICRLASTQNSCNNTWLTRPGYYVPGGSYDGSAYTALLCRDSCLRYTTCKGFDFDGAARCWLIFSATDAKADSNNHVTHYQLYRGVNSCNATCNGSSGLSFSETQNAHVNGGNYWTADKTLDDCLKRCADPTCRGFDWDPENPYSLKCWINSFSRNPIQADSPGVNHYEKLCVPNGINIVSPSPLPYEQRSLSASFSTVAPLPYRSPDVPAAVVGEKIYLQPTTIKPAYIVLIALGGGCILLTIIAVAVLCMYPLKGDKGGGGYSRTTRTTKTTTTTTTHRPKSSSSNEQIGMSTVTAVHSSRDSYERTPYDDNRNTHISNGSANNDEYNRSNGGGSVRQSTYNDSRQYQQDDYDKSGGGSQRESDGYHNDGYNTVNSASSKKSGYANEGYNSVGSKKSGYEDQGYDRESQMDRGSTLERNHDRVESIAEEANEDDYHASRNSRMSGNATYNQEDYY